MPTNPHQDMLYRELAIVQVRDLFPQAAPLLKEIVNFSTHAFVRCLSNAKGEENIHLAPFALYRHLLELTDSIEIMITNGCPSAAAPNMRSAFEGLLSLEYIMQPGAEYRTRSLTWLAAYARRRLRTYRKLLITSTESKDFLKAIANDKAVCDFPTLPQDKVAATIANLESLLSRNQFREIQEEYDRFKHPPKWHHLFGGPKNLYELARHLGRSAQYEILYRQWSTTTHAEDFFPFIAPAPLGEHAIRGLRDLSPTNEVATFTATFLIDATRLLIDKFHPGEMWGNWYLREVRDPYLATARSIRS